MATEVMTAPEGRIIHKTYAVLSGAAIPQRVYVTQYDESLPVIACTLYKDGQLYTIPDGASVRMRMNKNGLPVYHEAMGIDDARHVVYLEITAQMTVLYGEFAMVIEVETSDGKTAGTSYLRLIVRQNPVQNPELDNIPDYTANSNRLTAEGVKKLQDESSTQQKAIEDKGKNTLESIPADYSTLSGKVDENTSGISELKEEKADKTDLDIERKRIDVLNDGGLNLKNEVIDTSIKAWLADHPEATTTVQDGSITETKIETDFLLEIKNFVTLESFGAKGDGVSDDTEPLKKAVKSGRNIKLLDKKIYCVNLVDTLLNINNVTIYCEGQSTIKSIVNASDTGLNDTGFHYCFYLTGKNFTIKNVTFDANNEWLERPLVESGNEWDNYIKKRNSTIGNTKITDSENVNLSNVKFLNGLFSLKISKSSKIKIYECEFSKTIADSLYITDGTTDAIIENCIAHYNGDDTYCVNVDSSGIPERVTFINCSGHNLYGYLCKVHGGKNVSFVNCSGICQRTGGLSVEAPSESVWGKTTENIIFENCVVKSSGGGYICYSKDITQHKNVAYINCTFDTDHVVYVAEFNSVKFENCNFTNGFDIYRSENIELVDCVIESKNNLNFQDARNITVRYCIIRNKCEINDNIHDNRATDDLHRRRCINLMRGYIHTFGNSYFFANDNLKNYDIAFDANMRASGFQSKIDTSKILQENDAEYKILKSGIILEEDYSIYNLVCLDVGNIIMKKDGTIMIKNFNGWKKLQYSD